jgi:phospholipid/cholesterol/gamma-HCH transport system substrate-binding protein
VEVVKEKSIEVKVGALVLFTTALLIGFIFLLGGVGGGGGFELGVDFPTASDLKTGAPVKIAGVTAGEVQSVEYWGGRMDPATGRRVTVRVMLDLDPEKGTTLHEDAEFYISTQGILGEKYVEIDPGSWQKPTLPAGSRREGVPPMRMEVLGQQLTRVSAAVTRILETNEKTLGDLLIHTDQTVLDARKAVHDVQQVIQTQRPAIERTVAHLETASERADQVALGLHTAVGDGESLKRSVAHVESVAAQIDVAAGPIVKDARAVGANLKTASEKLRDGGAGEMLLGPGAAGKIEKTLDRVAQAAGDVQALTGNARTGRGTIGGLLMDNELFMDLKLMLKDLKRHPWKFIWRE